MWLTGEKLGVDYKFANALCPISFETIKWKFSTFGPVCNLGLCQGDKGGLCTQSLPTAMQRGFQRWEGGRKNPPVLLSLSYFHWALLFWLQFSPYTGVKIFPGEKKMLAPGSSQVEVTVLCVAEKVGLRLGLWFCSDTWTIHTLLDTYEGRKLDFLRLWLYQQGCMAEN